MKIVNNPSESFIPLKKLKSETPMITSGRTIGRKLIDCMYERPKNLYQLTPIDARVPRSVATSDDVKATMRLFISERHNGPDSNMSCSYHLKEKPVMVVSLDALN